MRQAKWKVEKPACYFSSSRHFISSEFSKWPPQGQLGELSAVLNLPHWGQTTLGLRERYQQ